ncbi:non-hydrolyzing UDP-N-acetylglucosamine 2-epimerase [Geomobilimonas luticola]|uniref:UDP-N-acetylglucosamine 2-epimerase (Non-hydrolyzing) n=1 Tax=Geomobilimonas luticola TaxID=1114878 RepID=A0ABS5SA89_9BACT|nr:UDP-N-acetylglucosamine 2-epimerase (non-hydrolyzing) [Geomobilimonas luticola]MBT0652293.1 UDP-N-acetylglucosamine 2-epimerase (non-hydrolyzing) [Geomobilimonas luticola]
MKIINVVGARPNFVKMAPIMTAMARCPERIQSLLLHTGQHYDCQLSGTFFTQLGMPRPSVCLEVGDGTPAEQTARIMIGFEKVCQVERPDLVLVVGDVTSTLACALAARQCGIAVAHVEAGLRSFDSTMPEELNRRCTDQMSDYLFTTEPSAGENLLREGIGAEKIHFVGNVMIDTLLQQRQRAAERSLLRNWCLQPGEYGLLTLHRPANVDSPEVLARLLEVLAVVAQQLPLIFPVHPRTLKVIDRAGLTGFFTRSFGTVGIRLVDPQGYLDFLHLMMHARLVLTDSGGIQEETTVLRVPCLTLRDNTERPVTCEVGTNVLVGSRGERLLQEAGGILAGRGVAGAVPEKWDGRAAERIVEVLLNRLP